MDAIVAVYSDWGIGCGGTQPIALQADRAFFRRTTQGACVIVGRRTLGDFPGGKPLPNRQTIVLSAQGAQIPGAQTALTPLDAAKMARETGKPVFVIGGASVYRAMLPYCRRILVTKLSAKPVSDVFFPDLDGDPQWICTQQTLPQSENGIAYRFCTYTRASPFPVTEP